MGFREIQLIQDIGKYIAELRAKAANARLRSDVENLVGLGVDNRGGEDVDKDVDKWFSSKGMSKSTDVDRLNAAKRLSEVQGGRSAVRRQASDVKEWWE